ncbi:hypothetical protein BKA70DRAFT_1291665 [Coprinopsis sp. MPI-PUGE-AT-0042]|nr:hypothetical protein BKA70DRAFT_1291665 [Coprinopsis sp. MPI-PUGE-AT-0042]
MGFSDILAFTFTLALVGGFVYGVIYVVNLVNQSVESTKANLKSKGMDISANGVSVKTDKYVDRQDYIDATQRKIINVMEASSFTKGGGAAGPGVNDSSNEDSKRKRHMFRK